MKNSTTILPALLLIASFTANAQSLPSVQKISVRAPANIKIDGKATEWGNKFQAYDRGNHLYYTIANDDKNLYLVVYTSDYINLMKLTFGGLVFTISKPGNKLDNISITYPTTNIQKNQVVPRAAHEYYTSFKNDIVANKDKILTLMNSVNDKVATTFKEIDISGMKGISESRISIYNELGIKAKIAFDDKLALTYELAIPLKYIGFSTGNSGKLNYNIKLIGQVMPGANPRAPARPAPIDGSYDELDMYLDNPTDFGGEYTLAKK